MKSVRIGLASQTLILFDGDRALARFPVSTAARGGGEKNGSFKTPRGRHIVRAKIGADAPINAVFIGRRPTGEIYDLESDRRQPDRDWILTRILWLSGIEIGKNRLGDVDTFRRFIYIHGSPPDRVAGRPGSIGCVRMKNEDILRLFDALPPGAPVEIVEAA